MYDGPWFTTASPPLLAIHGDADDVNPYWASEQLFADATGPKWLVTVLGGSHLGPFTTGSVEPTVATLIADFLHAQLQHDAAAGTRDRRRCQCRRARARQHRLTVSGTRA